MRVSSSFGSRVVSRCNASPGKSTRRARRGRRWTSCHTSIVRANASTDTTTGVKTVAGKGHKRPPKMATGSNSAAKFVPQRSEMRVGSGPYTVPVSITGASRVSGLTISITFNPALLRVRSVSEGTFMRQGNVTPTFTQQVDAAAGRIDIAIVRPGDQVGASTNGLIAAILFEPVSAGTGTLTVSGSGTIVGGAAATLQFAPAGVVIR